MHPNAIAGVDRVVHRRRLPIVQPCHADWEAMPRAGDSARYCERCSQKVHDFDSMTEAQARALLDESSDERLCVRYWTDRRGRIRFAVAASAVLLSGCATASMVGDAPTIEIEAPEFEEPSWSFATAMGIVGRRSGWRGWLFGGSMPSFPQQPAPVGVDPNRSELEE